jgi:hypothetical protein
LNAPIITCVKNPILKNNYEKTTSTPNNYGYASIKRKTIEYNNVGIIKPSGSPVDGTTIEIGDLAIVRCNLCYFCNKRVGKTSQSISLQSDGVKDAIAFINDESQNEVFH